MTPRVDGAAIGCAPRGRLAVDARGRALTRAAALDAARARVVVEATMREGDGDALVAACAALERAVCELAGEVRARPPRAGQPTRDETTRPHRAEVESVDANLSWLGEDVDDAFGVEDAGDARARATRRLEAKCARLEATVSTLRETLARPRGTSAVAHDVLAREIVALRRRLTSAKSERERLLEISNDLRAALRRKESATVKAGSSSAPVIEATPTAAKELAWAVKVGFTSTERETQSQRLKLKSALRRAKAQRAAAFSRVRHWGIEHDDSALRPS